MLFFLSIRLDVLTSGIEEKDTEYSEAERQVLAGQKSEYESRISTLRELQQSFRQEVLAFNPTEAVNNDDASGSNPNFIPFEGLVIPVENEQTREAMVALMMKWNQIKGLIIKFLQKGYISVLCTRADK